MTARSTASLTDLLTPAELRVALAVAKGATNREVAADLFVSAKTVEYHLQNVYRKLNLRSRTELAVRVSQASPDLEPTSLGRRGGRDGEAAVEVGRVVEAAEDPAVAGRPRGARWTALSEPPSANGREPVAWARIWPIMPPWANAATRWSGWAAAMRPTARRDPRGEGVGRLGVRDHVPALLGDHAHGDRVALGHLLAEHAALPVAEEHLVEVGVDDHRQLEGASPARAAVSVVRRSFET